MLPVSTSIDPITGGLLVNWTKPLYSLKVIDAYLIEISDSLNDAWFTETTDCDGSNTMVMKTH